MTPQPAPMPRDLHQKAQDLLRQAEAIEAQAITLAEQRQAIRAKECIWCGSDQPVEGRFCISCYVEITGL